MKDLPISLGPYLDTIRELCEGLGKHEVIHVILELAKSRPAHERTEFLETIRRYTEGKDVAIGPFFDRYARLKRDIEERIASIEDGTIYDHYDFSGWDDEPDALSDELEEELRACFDLADERFLSGDLKRAGEWYAALFRLFDESDGYGLENALACEKQRETIARYCRCLYETGPVEARVETLLEALKEKHQANPDSYDASCAPMLADVIDALPEDLPKQAHFLQEWRTAVGPLVGRRADMLSLEAAYLCEGTKGVADLARRWGAGRPHGYLYLIHLQEKAGDWKEASLSAAEALNLMPSGRERAEAAAVLIRAGEILGKTDMVLEGTRERFCSVPDVRYLLDLVECAEASGDPAGELTQAISVLNADEEENNATRVLALVLAGKLEKAFAGAGNTPALGWSFAECAAGALFAAVLAACAGTRAPDSGPIAAQIYRYTNEKRLSTAHAEDQDEWLEEPPRMPSLILEAIDRFPPKPANAEIFMQWAEELGRKRVEQIVSSKYRKAYGRAAETLTALAECMILRGDESAALSLVSEFTTEKFNRHSAFLSEVSEALGESEVLRRVFH